MLNILSSDKADSSPAVEPSQAEAGGSNIGRVEVKRDLCIGAQTCVALAGDVFEMDAENKAIVKNPKGADDETILMGARSCPTLAIFIYDKKGQQIFP
jgi:ferredoxin